MVNNMFQLFPALEKIIDQFTTYKESRKNNIFCFISEIDVSSEILDKKNRELDKLVKIPKQPSAIMQMKLFQIYFFCFTCV